MTFPKSYNIIFTKNRGIAQLVEHWSPKPGVVSSNPTAPANTIKLKGELLMKAKKMTITVKVPKPRNFALIDAQIKGLMRTKVIKNKKKEVKKFNKQKALDGYLIFNFS